MNSYKGYKYFKDEDGLWKIIIDKENLFVVALDDSKQGGTKIFSFEKNNAKTCEKYIDWLSTE